jgi:hypothetical protein
VDFNENDIELMRAFEAGEARRRNIIFGSIAAVVLLLIIIGSIDSRPQTSSLPPADIVSTAPQGLADNVAAPAANPPAPQSNWTYSTSRDQVRNADIASASVRSDNTVNLDFPYGTVGMTMTVRRHPEYGLDVIFQVDEGQILCSSYEGCHGTINIDGHTKRISLNGSADNNPAVVFARSPASVLRDLQRSHRVIIELPFYQNGNQQFTFNTSDLRWPPSNPAH